MFLIRLLFVFIMGSIGLVIGAALFIGALILDLIMAVFVIGAAVLEALIARRSNK